MNSPIIRSSTKYVVLPLLFSVFFTLLNAQQTVTIQECYRLAEENYPQIRQYDLIRKAEQYDLSNAGKSWLPQFVLNAKATYQSDVTKLPVDFSQLPVEITVPTLSKDQYQVMAELNQTIWDGGASSSAKQLTKSAAETERKQLESDLYSLRERINQLYFGCLLQADLLLQNRLLQKELQINLERVQAFIANGMANESDKELLEVELLNASQRETEIDASRLAYLRMLSYFIGYKEPGKIQLEKLVVPAVDFSWSIKRPELSVFEAKSIYADLQLKAITAGLMPRFGAFVQAGYGRPGLNMLEDEFSPFYVAGVRMR
ncbi:MAG: TolC family protein, partial [Massilibacteroides sp.]|nr:TolC family protein [Massilibacteroides sp.]